jgi:hypothetical protein
MCVLLVLRFLWKNVFQQNLNKKREKELKHNLFNYLCENIIAPITQLVLECSAVNGKVLGSNPSGSVKISFEV